MVRHNDHLREKALRLRAEQHLSLDEITERLRLPRGTIYHWIKDVPMPPRRQHAGQRQGTAAMQAKYAALRDAAYQQGLAEAPVLLADASFRLIKMLWNCDNTGVEF